MSVQSVPARIDIMGVHVSAINMAMAVEAIAGWIARAERRYVCVTGVHGIMESKRCAELRRVHNAASMVTPDGMPLVWLLKWGGLRHVDRVYGPDLMLAALGAGQLASARHFFYGTTEPTLAALRARLCRDFPKAQIVGGIAPPFRPLSAEEDREHMAAINSSAPDIVWVGLSTPKQERWMAAHRDRLNAAVLIGVGAAFDIHAGVVPQAPRLLQRSGLEWAFRLCTDPRRLWRRYAVNVPSFIFHILVQKLG
ncbi:N-acetylglucosaminyldiphosphoundecaprenol N-acetyl-beta-D-mannosaminyltransferase [Rhodospirillales bacterium URHD0017]|nr:N-acetylglucosaminyldiphosphoundecaprenol N-acetyl-beta-D-mannosaminyltransferase [Rhodospirillales bacterium URHD0017]